MPAEVDWFPERAWGGRVWVPCSAHTESEEGTLELFGHVSYVQPPAASRPTSQAKADFTDVLAADNPDWRIDLNDDVIGRWRGENGRAGAVTLVWGRPLVRGAVAATAELDGETVDQEEISQRPLHPDRPRRPRGLRRRDLHGGQALEPARRRSSPPRASTPETPLRKHLDREVHASPLARASRASKVSSGSSSI